MAKITDIPHRIVNGSGVASLTTIRVYEAGTSTDVDLFSDENLTNQVGNPLNVAAGDPIPTLYHGFAGDVRIEVVDAGGPVFDDDPYDRPVSTGELAGGEGSAMVGVLNAGTGAYVRTQADVNMDRPTVLDFIEPAQVALIRANNHAAQNPALVAAGLQAAFDAGVGILPSGTYHVGASLNWPSGLALIGAGRSKTILRSAVIGGSLLKTNSSANFLYMAHMSLKGNAVAGSLGNGHAIDFIDFDLGGSKAPAQSMVYQVEISGFKGQGRVSSAVGAGSIASCAVIAVNVLQNLFRDIYISDCGHGFFLQDCENIRIENCATDGIVKFAALVMSSENVIISNSTLIDAGDGTADTGYPLTAVPLGSGVLCSYQNNGLVVTGCKFKNNRAGKATIQSLLSNGDAFIANWIRADALTNTAHRGIYALRPNGLNIVSNHFHPATTGTPSQKYMSVEVEVTANSECPTFRIEGNLFADVSGMGIAYNVRIAGDNRVRPVQGVIQGNTFGSRQARSAATVVDSDILLENCSLQATRIANNAHLAAGNVTRTGVTNNNTILNKMEVGPNAFLAGAGTIAAEYTGVSEGQLVAVSASYDPPALATGVPTPVQTTTVTGAAVGDMATAAWSADLAGSAIFAWVSASNTVSWFIQNVNGSNPLNLASGTARLRVRKAWAA
ncbi:right-handed parallel beta-helix repeat-containing protein [Sphingopyxis sp.]|uniref:right-handed parallel beta-helix repeat-containing protein n=1 Tax=Sphingopyxis sp. TaxID=1908224 RepID=UPI002EDA09C9